jgi:hypothetical protein
MRLHAIGWDTGAHLGWVHIEAGFRPKYINGGKIEVGHQVERRLANGKVRMLREITDLDIDHAMDVVLGILCDAAASTQTLVVGIPRVVKVHPTARHEARTGQSIGLAIGKGISDAQWIGGEIRRLAICLGLTAVTVEEATWRQAICGSSRAPRGRSADQWIAQIIPARIDGWPKNSNPHMRDAAGVAEWVATRFRLDEARSSSERTVAD